MLYQCVMKFILQIQNSPKYVASTNDVDVPSAALLELTKADAETNDYEDKVLSFHEKKEKTAWDEKR
jgi:hypothetical protein